MAELLLRYKADPDIATNEGGTPLLRIVKDVAAKNDDASSAASARAPYSSAPLVLQRLVMTQARQRDASRIGPRPS